MNVHKPRTDSLHVRLTPASPPPLNRTYQRRTGVFFCPPIAGWVSKPTRAILSQLSVDRVFSTQALCRQPQRQQPIGQKKKPGCGARRKTGFLKGGSDPTTKVYSESLLAQQRKERRRVVRVSLMLSNTFLQRTCFYPLAFCATKGYCPFRREQFRSDNPTTMETPEITVDDLRHKRTWLLQHGIHELTTVGGMSFLAAARKLEKDVEELSRKIDKLEGK